MKNNKGFVMTETLVVTVFLVTIFTFIYVSIVPLIGRYEDLIYREGDVDIVYKLYSIRKLLEKDSNKNIIVSSGQNNITCNSFYNKTYCNKLLEYLELTHYKLIYVDDIYDHLDYIENISKEAYEYMYKYKNVPGEVLILLDTDLHTIGHLFFDSYFGDRDKPSYYNYGTLPSYSSSTVAPTNYNIYLGLYYNGVYSVCTRMVQSEYCFANNDFQIEKDHLKRVFSKAEDTCAATNTQIRCYNSLFDCTYKSNGTITCTDLKAHLQCSINGSDTASCKNV